MTALTLGSRRRGIAGWLIVTALAFEVAGCATVAARHEAKPLDDSGHRLKSSRTKIGLVISGQEEQTLASRYFGAVRITFENPSSHWVHVRNMRISFGSEAKNDAVLLPWGSDIESWVDATMHRNAIREANRQTALELLALGGWVASKAAGRESQVGVTGGVVAAGAVTVMTADAIGEPTRTAEAPPIFPNSHLLAVPFSVPPGLFANKWILLQTPDPVRPGCIRSMILDYETDVGTRERVLVPFRDAEDRSEWQARVCVRPRRKSM